MHIQNLKVVLARCIRSRFYLTVTHLTFLPSHFVNEPCKDLHFVNSGL